MVSLRWPLLVMLGLLLASCAATPGTKMANTSRATCPGLGQSPDQTIAACDTWLQTPGLPDQQRSYALVYRATAYNAKRRFPEAVADLNQAIKLDPDNRSAYQARAAAYDGMAQPERAVGDLSEAIRIEPTAGDYLNRGAAYIEIGDLTPAMQDTERALQLQPDFAEAFHNRGNIHLLKGDDAEAMQDFERALRLDPKLAGAYVNRGIAHHGRGRDDLAIADFDHGIALEPKNANFYSNRAQAYATKQDFDRAFADFDRAIALEPNDSVYLSNKLITLLFAGRDNEALDLARAYAERDTYDPYGWMMLFITRGRLHQDAIGPLRASAENLDREDDWPAPIVLHLVGQMSEPDLFQELEKLPPADQQGAQCDAYYFLGEAAVGAGDIAQARKWFTTGLGPCDFGIARDAIRQELKRL